jgi:hypothetical protein
MDPAIMGIVMIIALVIVVPIVIKVARSHKCNYGEVKDDYQYCTVCGQARAIDLLNCQHKWKTVSTQVVTSRSAGSDENRKIGEIHIMECEKCGDKKEFKYSIN